MEELIKDLYGDESRICRKVRFHYGIYGEENAKEIFLSSLEKVIDGYISTEKCTNIRSARKIIHKVLRSECAKFIARKVDENWLSEASMDQLGTPPSVLARRGYMKEWNRQHPNYRSKKVTVQCPTCPSKKYVRYDYSLKKSCLESPCKSCSSKKVERGQRSLIARSGEDSVCSLTKPVFKINGLEREGSSAVGTLSESLDMCVAGGEIRHCLVGIVSTNSSEYPVSSSSRTLKQILEEVANK